MCLCVCIHPKISPVLTQWQGAFQAFASSSTFTSIHVYHVFQTVRECHNYTTLKCSWTVMWKSVIWLSLKGRFLHLSSWSSRCFPDHISFWKLLFFSISIMHLQSLTQSQQFQHFRKLFLFSKWSNNLTLLKQNMFFLIMGWVVKDIRNYSVHQLVLNYSFPRHICSNWCLSSESIITLYHYISISLLDQTYIRTTLANEENNDIGFSFPKCMLQYEMKW